MATYRGTFACGHEGEIKEVGQGRQERAAWKFENHLCPDCYKIQQEEKAQKTIKEFAGGDLPELEGTPKQVAWALKIRQEWLSLTDKYVTPYKKAMAQKMETADDKGLYQAGLDAIDRALTERNSNTSAKFWIENRFKNPYNLAKEVATAAGKEYLAEKNKVEEK